MRQLRCRRKAIGGMDMVRHCSTIMCVYGCQVVVTAHAATRVAGSCTKAAEEWRVLRFNEATRQSVSRVHATGAERPAEAAGHAAEAAGHAAETAGQTAAGAGRAAGGAGHSEEVESAADGGAPCWRADPRCLAFEYTKTIATAVASVVGAAGLHH